jgi:outer membrane biosynthesis protein TonB
MRRVDPFDRRAMALSIVLHGTVIAVALLSSLRQEPTLEFITYEVDLVSPPPAVEAEEYTPPSEELVVERPEPEPAPPEPEPEPEPQVTVTQPEPEPQPTAPAPTPPPEPQPDPSPAAGPNADPNQDPATSGEGINVRMEGLRRDYPEYWNNIIRQIQRCFRPPTGNWSTTMTFVIRRDGSVDDLEFERRSGNTSFDYLAMEAVECAGQGRFGALPPEMPFEYQLIRFEFRPSGRE